MHVCMCMLPPQKLLYIYTYVYIYVYTHMCVGEREREIFGEVPISFRIYFISIKMRELKISVPLIFFLALIFYKL